MIKFRILLLLLIFSCGSKKVIINSTPERINNETIVDEVEEVSEKFEDKVYYPVINNVNDYIDYFSQVAMDEMRTYKIPASITLAQGILESGSGKGRLSVEANNHFGIKCHDWPGPKIFHDDDEAQECFRKYNAPEYSYRDHSIFLTSRSRYSELFDLSISDYKNWAKGLKKAGYATDKKYPDKLINLIENYKLFIYDEIVLKKRISKKSSVKVNVFKHEVIKGDTLYFLSKKYNISIRELLKINNLKDKTLIIGQLLIIDK
ncbi:glucosaminidase domain-containing protein [Flavobacteriaceae bacterium]|nr:glucosaminidase domain-containing protein [Flavobacteriaceae bacterium]MDC1492263.1 glucosaminidase domain-containing protein [Flavobacteriaceae bacterium]